MVKSGGKKNSVRLLFLLMSIFFFWGTPRLFALHQPYVSENQSAAGLYAHSHHKPPVEQPTRPKDSHSRETLRLDVTGARLLCSEDECSHHHHDCALEIAYRLSADLLSRLDIGAHVVCHARLDYTTSHGYRLQSQRCSSPASHTLHQSDVIDSKIVVDFQFSTYEQVVEAQVGAIHCSIENVDILNSESTTDTPEQALVSD